MVSSTSIRVRNTTNEETANNKSSFSKRRRPDSAYSSHQSIRDEEVSGESIRSIYGELTRSIFVPSKTPSVFERSEVAPLALLPLTGHCPTLRCFSGWLFEGGLILKIAPLASSLVLPFYFRMARHHPLHLLPRHSGLA